MNAPQIDVLIPAFNAANTIVEAVQSIQRQTFSELAIHVIDDGSTDDTGARLRALMADDSRIKLHSQKNCGIVDALNKGLDHCTAPYVARLDADDIAHPDRLAAQVTFLSLNPNVIAVGSNARHINEFGVPTGSYSQLVPPVSGDPYSIPAHEPYLIHPTWLLRRDQLMSVGGYRHSPLSEDSDLLWRLSEKGQLANMHEMLIDYRVHVGGLSSASIVNGRIMAIGSQLAAFSARRRCEQRDDIAFSRLLHNSLRNARSLHRMMASVADLLRTDEIDEFNACVAGKLLELSSYRPYELEKDDCLVIRNSLTTLKRLRPEKSLSEARAHAISAAARLCSKGLWAEGCSLIHLRYLPAVSVRFLSRLRLFSWIRSAIVRKRRLREMVK